MFANSKVSDKYKVTMHSTHQQKVPDVVLMHVCHDTNPGINNSTGTMVLWWYYNEAYLNSELGHTAIFAVNTIKLPRERGPAAQTTSTCIMLPLSGTSPLICAHQSSNGPLCELLRLMIFKDAPPKALSSRFSDYQSIKNSWASTLSEWVKDYQYLKCQHF